MARKRTAKNEEQEEFDVDEPSEGDEGANDSSSQNENSAKKGGRRTSTRTRTVKKPYKGESASEDDEDEEEDGESEDDKPARKGGRPSAGGGRGRGRPSGGGRGKPPAKKSKKEEEEEDSEENEDSEDEEDGDGEESEGDAADTPPEFRSGCFVVLKSDIDNGEDDYPVWKIDGKSLLQKFDRFKHEDETLFKGTTIYAGWSKTVVDTYYPIKVEYKKVEGVDSAVKFDPAQIKKKSASEAGNGASTESKAAEE